MLDLELYKELVNLNGIAGHEKSIRQVVRRELEKLNVNIVQDKLGSIFGISEGKGPKIMFAGHMDEVGFMVTNVDANGLIRIIPVGGIKPEVYVSQNMQIIVNENKTIRGVIGSIPPHISKEAKPIAMEDLILDIGADDDKAAYDMGVQIGQQVVSVNDFYYTEDGKKIVSKAWDNRFGVGLAIELMRYASSHNHPNTIYAGATVQEEVGARGARTASQMVNPDMFFAFDVTTATDCMPANPRTSCGLGKGFVLRFYDPSCVMNPALKDYLVDLATKENIPFQYYAPNGSTDAGNAQYANDGSISTCLAICGRYIHSTATMIHLEDMEAVKRIALAIVDDFDEKRFKELLEKMG